MSASPQLHAMSLHPQLLQGGFWLYVWRIEPRYVSEAGHGPYLLYVGRTGDSSSANAAPPYRRLGQHLGHHPASNALRRHLVARNLVPEKCEHFDFFAYGPLFPAQLDMKAHLAPRDVVAALECKLAAALQDGGYDVMNEVRSLKPLDQILWQRVREAFREKFPRICD